MSTNWGTFWTPDQLPGILPCIECYVKQIRKETQSAPRIPEWRLLPVICDNNQYGCTQCREASHTCTPMPHYCSPDLCALFVMHKLRATGTLSPWGKQCLTACIDQIAENLWRKLMDQQQYWTTTANFFPAIGATTTILPTIPLAAANAALNAGIAAMTDGAPNPSQGIATPSDRCNTIHGSTMDEGAMSNEVRTTNESTNSSGEPIHMPIAGPAMSGSIPRSTGGNARAHRGPIVMNGDTTTLTSIFDDIMGTGYESRDTLSNDDDGGPSFQLLTEPLNSDSALKDFFPDTP